jgi:phage-related tail protein
MDKEARQIPTAEQSLAMLSDAVARASEDLRAARQTLDTARADIATRNTSLPTADILRESERVVDHLRKADQCLQELVKDLSAR